MPIWVLGITKSKWFKLVTRRKDYSDVAVWVVINHVEAHRNCEITLRRHTFLWNSSIPPIVMSAAIVTRTIQLRQNVVVAE